MQIPGPSAQDAHFLLFPALLLVYYLVCWISVGRTSKIETITRQYEPPSGVSPGVARYILTGGCDGTTLAAVLAQLAAREAIAIEPQAGSYRVTMRNAPADLAPEEAALLKVLTDMGPGGSLLIHPQSKEQMEKIMNAIHEALRKNFRGVYFRWNAWVTVIGTVATFVWALTTSYPFNSAQLQVFLVTCKLLVFTSGAGWVSGAFLTSRPARQTLAQRSWFVVITLFCFIVPGFIAYFAVRVAAFFFSAVLISVMLNSIFIVIMRAPTPQGQRVLEHLEGFQAFLVREQEDQPERMDSPQERAALINRSLPYAIALGVKVGWGDDLAAAVSLVER